MANVSLCVENKAAASSGGRSFFSLDCIGESKAFRRREGRCADIYSYKSRECGEKKVIYLQFGFNQCLI